MILFTGSEGFIGGHLKKIIKGVNYDLKLGDDVRDKFKLDLLFEKNQIDCVVNLAARAGVRRGEDFPEEYFSTNVLGLTTLISLSEKYKVKKFIHFSSSSVFGQSEPRPYSETEPKNPKSVYAISKLAGELLLQKSNLDYTIIRPFTVIGEGGREEMVIMKWLNQIKSGKPVSFYGDGSTSRGYTYVDDLVSGIQKVLENPRERQDFNLGGDQIITLNELWEIFKEEHPSAQREILPLPKSDQLYSLASTKKAQELLGWKPQCDIKQKIKKLIK